MQRQWLREMIGRRLADGRLPMEAPVGLEVRRGTGMACDACGRRIGAFEIEHEFNYHDGHPFRLHFDCAGLWMALRRRRSLDRAS
jgi:hypothetical protein